MANTKSRKRVTPASAVMSRKRTAPAVAISAAPSQLRRSKRTRRSTEKANVYNDSERTQQSWKKTTMYFDLLPIEVNGLIALMTRPFRNPLMSAHDPMQHALMLLQVNGYFREAAAIELGSWTESTENPLDNTLWLNTKGAKYKSVRNLVKLMGEHLHTITFKSSLTKKYANIIRVHAKGLRCVHICTLDLPMKGFEGMKAVLRACGTLDLLSVQCRYTQGLDSNAKYIHALPEFVANVRTLQVKVMMPAYVEGKLNLRDRFGELFNAACKQGSKSKLVVLEIHRSGPEDDVHVELHISQNENGPGATRFLVNGVEMSI